MLIMAEALFSQEVVQYPYHCYMEWPMPMPMDSSFVRGGNSITGEPTAFYTAKLSLNKTRAREFVVDTPTTIYGIAAILWGQDTAQRDLSVVLYECQNERVTPLKEVRWFDSMPFRRIVFEASNCWLPEAAYGLKFFRDTASAYDFYFDTPVTVTDTFLVGYRTFGVDGLLHEHHPFNNRDSTGYAYVVWMQVTCDLSHNSLRPRWYFIHDDSTRHHPSNTNWAGVLPIIEPPCNPDTLFCPAVQDFTVSVIDSLSIEFSWSSLPEQQNYQISVGRQGTPPDSGHLFYSNVTSPFVINDNWDTNEIYVAYIRAQCERHCHPYDYDTLLWGVWSDPVNFSFPHHSGPTGIATAERDARVFTLTPNPAKGIVTVRTSAYSPNATLTLRDAAGRELLTMPVKQPSITIPLHNYPAGTYLVTLSTPGGTSSQRLVVD